MENIFKTIKQEVDDFINNDIEVVDGYTFNQYDTIKQCHLYYNSQFLDQSLFNGREKMFFNVVKYRCQLATTILDFDTKNIRLWPSDSASEIGTFLLEKELKYWLKNNKIANLLNDISEELPIYGSVVLKKNKNAEYGAELCDLRRLFLDPTVKTICDSSFVIQKHFLTASQLREMDGKWENVDKVIKDFKEKTKTSYEDGEFVNRNSIVPAYVVYERYGEVPESWVKEGGDENKMVRSLFITTNPNLGTNSDGLILFKSEWKKEYPFKDAHYSKTRGRWLGVGLVEDLFPIQQRENEIGNQKRVATEIGFMQLFQTSDQTLLRNVLTDRQSGDVLRKEQGSEGLAPVDTRVKDMNAFTLEIQDNTLRADRISFANDVVRGGEIPASTPATNAMIQNTNSKSVFIRKGQDVANMLRDFFNELVLPQAVSDLSLEHTLRFAGSVEELNKLDKIITKSLVRDEMLNRMFNGEAVTEEEAAMLEQKITSKVKSLSERFLKIKEKLYRDLEYDFDIMVDNEQENVSVLMNNIFQIFTALASNPTLLDDPRIKVLFYDFMEKGGINPLKLELAENEMKNSPMGGQMGIMSQIQDRLAQVSPTNQPQLAQA